MLGNLRIYEILPYNDHGNLTPTLLITTGRAEILARYSILI